jgi:hypothetical protein
MINLTPTQELLDTLKIALLGNYEHPLITLERYEEHGYRGLMWKVSYLAENIPQKWWIFSYHEQVPILSANIVLIDRDLNQSAIFYDFLRDIEPGLQKIVTATLQEYAAANGIARIIPLVERQESYTLFQDA